MPLPTSTIAAVATPPGKGGIGIVRISGPEAVAIAGGLFRRKRRCTAVPDEKTAIDTHRLYYGQIFDPGDDGPVDEVLMAVMEAPHSYTREDVVEIQAHGGSVVLRRILELVLRAGAQLAEPGEFTKRAFLNGRIDLSQAEAVADMIQARTDAGLKIAGLQLSGTLRDSVEAVRSRLLDVLVAIEAGIDFPEEVGADVRPKALGAQLNDRVLGPLCALLENVDRGRIFREGLQLGIVGSPNVGKSSLMNRLVQQDRVIVSEVPGTTRDTVEESLDIRGIPATIIDTAGIQETDDPVERIGVRKTREVIDRSDLVLFVLDGSRPPTDNERRVLETIPEDRILVVVNKSDRICPDAGYLLPRSGRHLPVVETSALYNRRIDTLKERIAEMAIGGGAEEVAHGLLPNLRHKLELERACEAARRAISSIRQQEPFELVAISIQEALSALGRILGVAVSDDVLDSIFSRFCIGK